VAVDWHHNPQAFAAIERWIAHARIAPGTALFRRIHPRGASASASRLTVLGEP
jgi:hypothetical protein